MSIVLVRNAHKYRGSKEDGVHVLQNLNMTVPKGIIYGLLGPSGCGKTTLLNCILGQKQLNEGQIWILGGPPNSKGSKVPGPDVGFMPQISGLQDEYTTREMMQLFGGLAGMSKEEIKERMLFLQELLSLPDLNVRIGQFSGGEKRRASFAVALVNQPELLILDEPTVGLDPLLREKIWNYLYEITRLHQTTVILTTHYIDETRKANMVGLLRGGRILAEEPPDDLLTRFGVHTLEEVFFNLSVDQDCTKNTSDHSDITTAITCPNASSTKTKSPNRIKPLLLKNFQWILKHYELLITSIFVPIFQIFILVFAIGRDPVNLNLAAVNDETIWRNCTEIACNSTFLGCHFLNDLETKFNLTYYTKKNEAIESVINGNAFASIYLGNNYSAALKERMIANSDSYNVDYSIEVYRDVSQYPLAQFVKLEILKSFQKFAADYAESCKISNRSMSIPIKWNEPVHGASLPNYSEFIIPGMVVVTITFYAAWANACSLMSEMSNGVTERSLLMGAKMIHVLFAHAVIEFVMVIIQAITIVICIFINTNTSYSSLYVLMMLTTLMGIFGMCYGTALASVFGTDSIVTFAIMGSMFPSTVLSGLIWPIEGMPIFLQKIVYILPFADAIESMRSAIYRGWTVTHSHIYTSIFKILLWILVFLLIVAYCLKKKKR